MEAVLVTRNSTTDTQGNLTTQDLRLEVNLAGRTTGPRETIESVPASEWNKGHPGFSSNEHATVKDLSYKPHALQGFSAFGTDETNEFATFTQGRETLLSNQDLREECEDDLRGFAEKSDHTEGFMLSSSLSDGFSGFTTTLLESLRDEFPKSTVFTTGMIDSSRKWIRTDTERSQGQRLMNQALSLVGLEELSSMLLPVQPARMWQGEMPWNKYIRDDLDKLEVYDQVLMTHLQSANTELREPDSLSSIVQQLNWRGDNKIASLSGVTPIAPSEFWSDGKDGVERLKKSWLDFSTLPDLDGTRTAKEETPYAQYSVVRGFSFEESQQMGPILESTTLLKHPLSQWVSLPTPYPILPPSLPIYRSLLPTGRPLQLSQPSIPSSLFGLPDTRYPLPSSYIVQPTSIPILTTLSTSPSTRHLLNHLSKGVKELLRVRSGVLREFEDGEYGVGREGVLECRERLEGLMDAYGGGGAEEEEKDEDENWDETEDNWDL